MRFDEGIFGLYARIYENRREVECSLEDYLRACSDDPSFFAGAAERLLKAIGEPIMVDTSQDPRLGRIFMNRTTQVFPTSGGSLKTGPTGCSPPSRISTAWRRRSGGSSGSSVTPRRASKSASRCFICWGRWGGGTPRWP